VEKDGVARKKKDLRARCLNSDILKDTPHAWALDTPYDIRDEAMNDLLKAYKTCFAKKDLSRFRMKHRSRKSPSESIALLAKHYGHRRGEYARIFGAGRMKSAEPLPEKLLYDARLQKISILGEYYLVVPQPLPHVPENQGPAYDNDASLAIALDPGVRTFFTGYNPDGTLVEWGKNDMTRIYRLCHVLDKLQTRVSDKALKHRKRYKLRNAMARIRKRIKNLVDEAQRKFARWLCENHKAVLIPKFETSQMVARSQRRIGSKTARAMCTWAHYRFRMRLLDKAREFPLCNIIVCDEVYTSKTCGICGRINNQLGTSKTFSCGACGYIADRDANGARNILLRYMSINRASPR